MPIGWFLCPYKRRPNRQMPTRYCAMDDFTAQITADGGRWSASEVLGDTAVVKVLASNSTLNTIEGTAGFQRIPLGQLHASLSSLSGPQRSGLRTRIEAMGYSAADITEALGSDLSQVTLGDVLRFIARRRLKPRYDAATDTIVLDGPEQPCRPIEHVDAEVT